ncbi:MAG: response regulator transcription factor [Balneolales bacterium]|nr:response regulator transcription factor [Balneolales bacterium]
MEKASNIIIIEDNNYIRNGWKTFVDFEDDLEVIGDFGSCEAAFEQNKLCAKTDLFLMDIGLPGMSGIEGVQHIKMHYPDAVCIMATVFDDDKHVFEALKAGAVGYMLKNMSPEELISAIRSALRGGSPLTPNVARMVIDVLYVPADGQVELSRREKSILEALAKGHSYNQIGKQLFLSTDGIRYHIRNIYTKLQVNSRSEAVSKAFQNRIINPDTIS